MFERFDLWLRENFWLVWLGSLGLTIITLLVGAIRRWSLGLPIRRPIFGGALFEENWRSGGRGLFGVNNCAWVSLVPGHLVTGVHFPFNLAVPRRLLRWAGVDNDIPMADIVAVDNESFFGRQRLRIRYRLPSGESSFWLDLRRPDLLREAIIAAMAVDHVSLRAGLTKIV
jgi:hypothetical protein